MTTTTVDTQAVVAGSGGQSTPVKLTLQASTQAVSLQMKVTTTRSATPSLAFSGKVKSFLLYWAFSPEDLTLANVPTLLRHCTKTQTMVLNAEIEQAGQRMQVRDKPNGQYLYVWFEYPGSDDAYAIVIQSTELFFSTSGLDWTGNIIPGQYGGTGVANTGKTITLAGNLTTTGAFNTTLAQSASSTVTIPASTTLPIASQAITFSGPTASRTVTLPDANITVARTDAANTFTGTQTIGAAVVTTLNGNTITTGSGVLTIAATKTLTASNTLTLAGTDATTMTFPTTSATIARTDAANTFTGTQTLSGQLLFATGTTSANGISMAAGEIVLFREAAGAVRMTSTGATAKFTLTSTTGSAVLQLSGNDAYIDNLTSGGSLILRNNGGTTAMTLGAAQQATIVGTLAFGGTAIMTGMRTATATLDFGSIAAGTQADLTITVTGAAVNDSVIKGLPAAPAAGIVFDMFVSSANIVTVRASNTNLVTAVDPVSATYRATVLSI